MSCLGLRLRYQPRTSGYVQLAVLDGVPGDPDDPRGTHVRLGGGDGALWLGEAGVQQVDDEGRFLRAALGAWHYKARFDDLLDTGPAGTPAQRHGSGGLYGLVEGSLMTEPGRAGQGLSGFLRLGVADEDVNPVGAYAGAGLVYTGLVPGRDGDVLGLGVSAAFAGDKYRSATGEAGPRAEGREVAWELTYRVALLPWLSVQFDVQHIANPGFDPAVDDATLVGLRYHVAL